MVIKRTPHNKNLLIAVLVFVILCLPSYLSEVIRQINQGWTTTQVQQQDSTPPIAVPLLPPSKAEVVRHEPTIPPIAIVTSAPAQIIPDHPEPPPAPDYFST